MREIVDLLVFSIPEAVVLFYLASSLLGKKFSWSRLVVMGIIFGVTIYLNHQMTENYIFSTLLSCFLIIILLKWVGSLEIYEAITSGLMALSLYLAFEFINIKTLQLLTGIDPMTLAENFPRRILWFLPQLLAVLMFSHIIRYLVHHFGHRKLMN